MVVRAEGYPWGGGGGYEVLAVFLSKQRADAWCARENEAHGNEEGDIELRYVKVAILEPGEE